MKHIQKKNYNAAAIFWLEHHLESFKGSLKQHLANALPFSFTVTMIAIALSIPLSLYIFFASTQQLTQDWDSDRQITLFLNDNIDMTGANDLAQKINSNSLVSSTTVVNKHKALEDFKQQMGVGAMTADLPENPLPHLIVVEPHPSVNDTESLNKLNTQLQNIEQVQLVQFDLLWFQRLQAILSVVNRIQWVIGIILLFAITIIIANVIRWEVTARLREIEIFKLVGASDAYVRRPFLYSGLWLGFTGSVLALIIVTLSSWLVERSTHRLMSLFGKEFELQSVSFNLAIIIIAVISLLSVIGSWAAVTHRLRQYY